MSMPFLHMSHFYLSSYTTIWKVVIVIQVESKRIISLPFIIERNILLIFAYTFSSTRLLSTIASSPFSFITVAYFSISPYNISFWVCKETLFWWSRSNSPLQTSTNPCISAHYFFNWDIKISIRFSILHLVELLSCNFLNRLCIILSSFLFNNFI